MQDQIRSCCIVVAESDDEEARVLERFMVAWDDADMTSLAKVLSEDAELTMPPEPLWFAGSRSGCHVVRGVAVRLRRPDSAVPHDP